MLNIPQSFLERVSNLPAPLTLVVNDATRPSPEGYIRALEPALPGTVRVLFATGAHRPVTDAEAKCILGGSGLAGCEMRSNMCDDQTHVSLGCTSRGTPVDLHPWILEGTVLALNTVEPHYFAGFTGGRKSFLPGCSSRRTIVANHFLACSNGTLPGKLAGNPVNEDMEEGASMLFSRVETLMINGVAGGETFFAGSPVETFHMAAAVSRGLSGVPRQKRFHSLEVKPGGTLEVSLYQSMKAVFLWENSVEDGGELVLSSPCPEGMGASQMEGILRSSGGILRPPLSLSEYVLGDHAALRMSKIRKRLRLTFRTGLDLSEFGFSEPPEFCVDTVANAGFTYPVMVEDNA